MGIEPCKNDNVIIRRMQCTEPVDPYSFLRSYGYGSIRTGAGPPFCGVNDPAVSRAVDPKAQASCILRILLAKQMLKLIPLHCGALTMWGLHLTGKNHDIQDMYQLRPKDPGRNNMPMQERTKGSRRQTIRQTSER